jgi:co-chaperonin GroES (HSP10)
MKPLRDEVVIIEIPKEVKTEAGIVLTDDYHTSRDFTCVGIVDEIANGVKNIKKGDKVLYKAGAYKTELEGKEVIFMRERSVMAILDHDSITL